MSQGHSTFTPPPPILSRGSEYIKEMNTKGVKHEGERNGIWFLVLFELPVLKYLSCNDAFSVKTV